MAPFDPVAPLGARADRSVSIGQVAHLADVSVATVSRVLNDKQSVKPQTRLRVMAAVDALGYRVNQMARSLRTDESRLLLTMVPDIGNPFYAQIVQGIDRVVQDNGYCLLLCETGGDANRERRYFDLLQTRRADGAICLDPDTIQQGLHQQGPGFPWVACCEFDSRADVPYVGIDNRGAAAQAVAYLISRGHTRIAFINSDTRFMYARERLQGYTDALVQAGLSFTPDYCFQVEGLDFSAGRRTVDRLLQLAERPTAVFAVSDTLAIGVMGGLRAAGLQVPDDMAVMGFDDISLAQQTCPALSTVAQPMLELGSQAARLLLNRLLDPTVPAKGVLLPHRLMLRESA